MSLSSVIADLFAGGGVTGLISAAIGAVAKHRELKLELEHKRFELKYEIQMQRMQIQADQALAEQELLIQKERGADAAFTSAIQAEGALSYTDTSRWVNDIRAIFRPALTVVLWMMVGCLMIWMPTEPSPLLTTVAAGVMQSASAATGFWFGSRAIKTSAP